MKTLAITLGFAALVAVGSASAQTLKAEIPFTFNAGSSVMPPGAYDVNVDAQHGMLRFQNVETRRSIILPSFGSADAPKDWRASGAPKLGFECAGSRCVLRQAYTGVDRSAYQFRGPKLGGDEPTRIAEIRLTKAD